MTPKLTGTEIRADWRAVEHLYRQFTAIVPTGEWISPEITSSLGISLGRVLAFYENDEPRFVQDLLELWSVIDKLKGSQEEKFRTLYFDQRLSSYRLYKHPPAPGKMAAPKTVRVGRRDHQTSYRPQQD